MCSRFICSDRAQCGILLTRRWIFGFNERLRISRSHKQQSFFLIKTLRHRVWYTGCLTYESHFIYCPNCIWFCEIWGFHGGEDDDVVLLGFGVVWTRRKTPTIWRYVLSSSSVNKTEMFLRNAGIYRRVYTAPEPRRATSSSHLNLLVQAMPNNSFFYFRGGGGYIILNICFFLNSLCIKNLKY
jgi:hypothetical protein